MDPAALKDAARAELAGYLSMAVGKPHLWLQDGYVDLGLVTLARAEATLTEGRLITKREAMERLPRLGVDPHPPATVAPHGLVAHPTASLVRSARPIMPFPHVLQSDRSSVGLRRFIRAVLRACAA
jgi:hypothetical protein